MNRYKLVFANSHQVEAETLREAHDSTYTRSFEVRPMTLFQILNEEGEVVWQYGDIICDSCGNGVMQLRSIPGLNAFKRQCNNCDTAEPY